MTKEEKDALMKEALEGMCYQYAYRGNGDDGLVLYTGGLSALELAFEALGWNDPQPFPEGECDMDGCRKAATCGTPTPNGYKRVCGDCMRKLDERDEQEGSRA